MVPQKERNTCEKQSRCQVPLCNRDPNMSVHTLPNGKKMQRQIVRQQWIEALKLEPEVKEFYVCGNHFSPNDFQKCEKRIRLKSDAVPIVKTNREIPDENIEVTLQDDFDGGIEADQKSYNESENSAASGNEVLHCLEIEIMNDLVTGLNGLNDEESPNNIPIRNDVNKDETEQTGHNTVDESIQTNLAYDESLRKFTVEDLFSSDYDLRICTAIPSFLVLENIAFCVDNLSSAAEKMKTLKVKTSTLIVIVMFKLKTALYFSQIAVLFKVKAKTLIKYFFEFVPILKAALKCVIFWPTKEDILSNLPKCFKPEFTDCCAIMDCTEIPIERLKSLTSKIKTFSHYKGTHTAKVNIVSTPSGLIIELSSAWGGKASDKHIVMAESVLDNFSENQAVMVDKGYGIYEECKAKGIQLYRPPILDRPQFTAAEAIRNTSIAKSRIHVERVIQRLKEFMIFRRLLNKCILKVIDDIMIIVCVMVNLSAPILSENKF